MPRIEKPIPQCLQCRSLIQKLFYAIRFDTCEGWCSEDCFYKWSDAEDKKIKEYDQTNRSNILRAQ